MGSKVLVLGISGGGKTTSWRNMDPLTSRMINSDRKEPPIFGWEEKYKQILNPEGIPDYAKSNYITPSRPQSVIKAIEIWENLPEVQAYCIDTITHMTTTDYVENTIGKEFKDYQKMGKNFYNVVDLVRDSKKDVVIYGHLEREFNEFGDKVAKMKSPGKMIESFDPPSFFTTVLYSYVERKDGKSFGFFRTQKISDAEPFKSPAYVIGDEVKTALEFIEPNDIRVILDKLTAFRKGILKDDLKQKDVKTIAQPDKKQ